MSLFIWFILVIGVKARSLGDRASVTCCCRLCSRLSVCSPVWGKGLWHFGTVYLTWWVEGERRERKRGGRKGVLGPKWELRGWSSGLVYSDNTLEKDISYYQQYLSYSPRFDSEGQALDGVSISDLRSGGPGGNNTNWKTLYEAKSENLGQGDKVPHTPHLRGLLQNTTLLLFSHGRCRSCAC